MALAARLLSLLALALLALGADGVGTSQVLGLSPRTPLRARITGLRAPRAQKLTLGRDPMDDDEQAATIKRLCFHCIRGCLRGKDACEKCIHGCIPASMISDNSMEDVVASLSESSSWI